MNYLLNDNIENLINLDDNKNIYISNEKNFL